MMYGKLLTGLALAAFGLPQAVNAQTTVDVELVLLVDVSGSVSAAEFNLQRQGYVNAFNNATLLSAFESGRSAAVTFVYWSSATQQQQAVGWTLINSAATSQAFAAAILGANRPFSGGTSIDGAINYAVPLFASNAFDSAFQVIDVSGDGSSGVTATRAARDAALAAGVDSINGLPILGEAGLLEFYQNNVQGGVGSFTIPANTFADFDAAVLQKLGREIVNPGGVPEPATWAMMLIGFGALGGMMRRNRTTVRIRFAAT